MLSLKLIIAKSVISNISFVQFVMSVFHFKVGLEPDEYFFFN